MADSHRACRAQGCGGEASPSAARLLNAAGRAPSVTQQVIWLHRAASAWPDALPEVSACATAAHIAATSRVTLARTEAEIGRAIGQRPSSPTRAIRWTYTDDLDVKLEAVREAQAEGLRGATIALPFSRRRPLQHQLARPTASSLLLNLDDLLRRLAPSVQIPVPYARSMHLKVMSLLSQPNPELADVPELFSSPR